ncbi:hypothetical protein N9M53_06490 [Alphaproteobacteria bacterium]|nr:hypothetical protein [Alphaproteobacteria bacterium]
MFEILIIILILFVGWFVYAKLSAQRFSNELISELMKLGMSFEEADFLYSLKKDDIHYMYFREKLPPYAIAKDLKNGLDGIR